MKLFHLSLLLLSVVLLNGCIAEDTDSCPEPIDKNLILTFDYPNDKGVDVFSANIHQVDVFVFDSEGRLVQKQLVDQTALSAFEGTELSLQPGTYRIVCWGNAFEKNKFDGVDTGSLFSDAFLGNSTLNGSVATNGDSLYYAPFPSQAFNVTVPTQGTQTSRIIFGTAHIKIEVFVKGFEDKSANGQLLAPTIDLTGVPAGYNFDMQTSDSFISYEDISSYRTIQGQQMAVIDFYTPLFTEQTPIQILIKKSSDGSTLTTISLKDFIKENNIVITDNKQVIIPILVEYKQTSVSVSLPQWGQNPVEPEID